MARSSCEWHRFRSFRLRMSLLRFRVACLVLATLVLISGPTFAASATSAHSNDRSNLTGFLVPSGQHVTVTGFTSVSYTDPSSGPISVQINQKRTTQLVGILNHLPVIKSVGCFEDSLMYKIVFRSSDHSRSDFEVNGYSCDAVVQIRGAGKFVTRRDSTCSLLNIVREDLPATARGTKVEAVGCNA
jgi:hypothetical protein